GNALLADTARETLATASHNTAVSQTIFIISFHLDRQPQDFFWFPICVKQIGEKILVAAAMKYLAGSPRWQFAQSERHISNAPGPRPAEREPYRNVSALRSLRN